jgi:hypothetical protein
LQRRALLEGLARRHEGSAKGFCFASTPKGRPSCEREEQAVLGPYPTREAALIAMANHGFGQGAGEVSIESLRRR